MLSQPFGRERGSSPSQIILYVAIFSIGFYTLSSLHDWIQWEKDRRQGKFKQRAEQSLESDYQEQGYTVHY